tara:strand:+ start:999 stop:1151 length:153 start_codon:yes stop_codon:yes gene_type:complete
MYPDILRTHIQKYKKETCKPFKVNVSMLYPEIDEVMDSITKKEGEIVFTF